MSSRIVFAFATGVALIANLSIATAELPAEQRSIRSDSPLRVETKAEAIVKSPIDQLGWDLTYQRVFEDAKLPKHDVLVSTLTMQGDASPMDVFSYGRGEPIEESVLIDSIAFWYFGYRMQTWLVKSASGAYAYAYAKKGPKGEEEPLPKESFDLLIDRLQSWPQSTPNPDLIAKYQKSGTSTGGYAGVVSVFRGGKARQFLLTFDDLMVMDSANGSLTNEPGPFNKLMAAAFASKTPAELSRRLNDEAVAGSWFAAARDPASDSSMLAGLTKQEANRIGRDGRSLLMVAAESGNVAAVTTLIKQGAEVNARAKITSGPYTALGMAARAGQKKIVEELLRLGAAVSDEQTGYRAYSEPLFEAASAGHRDVAQVLIDHGADPKGRNHNDYTLLGYLFFGGHPPAIEMVEFVLSQGVDINSANTFGQTALMQAVELTDRSLDIVTLLVNRGANINAVGRNGDSVMKIAQRKTSDSQRILGLLQEKGAQLTPQEHTATTPPSVSKLTTKPVAIHDVGSDTLDRDIATASQQHMVVAVFCATWAEPCTKYRKTVEQRSLPADARLVWVAVSENAEAAVAPYRVTGFPHTAVVWQGKVLAEQMGNIKAPEFDSLVESARRRLKE